MPGSADLVKEAIDAQSGRFEFFKQALTLSSAGIAGLAAILMDDAKIPDSTLQKVMIGLCGILFLLTVTFALWGISVYANLLTRLQSERGQPPDAKARVSSATLTASMVGHARLVFVALFFVALMLLVYAIVLLVNGPGTRQSKDAALLSLIASAQDLAKEARSGAADAKAAIAETRTDLQSRLNQLNVAILELKRSRQNFEPFGPLSREQIRQIQRALRYHGFDPGPFDGLLGIRTIAAIRNYQAHRADHPPVTGALTEEQLYDLLRD